MTTPQQSDTLDYDTRWQDMYKIGAIFCIAVSILILIAVIGYFIWPYAALDKTTADIFKLLQQDLWGGLVSLDLIMLITVIVKIFPMLAFYIALRRVNESYAFIALVLGLIAVATVIPARPVVEMALLSENYITASEADQSMYLAAGEVFRLLFDGTAWFIQTILLVVSGLIYSVLMLQSSMFNNKIAWTGIIIAIFGLGFWIPQVGIILLFLNTILTIPWYIFVARAFSRYGWKKQPLP